MVSVVILALVIVPVAHAFIVSLSTAGKSHVLGNATLATQNIIESIKMRGAGSVGNSAVNGTVPGDVFGGAGIIPDSSSGDGLYVFTLTGYEAGGSLFDAHVTINALNRYSDRNDIEITNYSQMDGVFSQPTTSDRDPDKLAAAEIAVNAGLAMAVDSLPGRSLDSASIRRNFTREITILVERDPGNKKVTVTAKYEYNYDFWYYPPIYDGGGNPTGDHDTTPVYAPQSFSWESNVFADKSDLLADGVTPDPVAIYFFYLPHYSADVSYFDRIEVDNREGINMSLYIVKQKHPSADYNDYDIELMESTYKAWINQYEPPGTPLDALKGKIYTNCNNRLVGTGSNLTGSVYRIFSRAIGYSIIDDPGAIDNELVSQTAKRRLFEVSVEIYANGEWGDPGAVPLVRIDGSNLE
jgi:hypothetical protein